MHREANERREGLNREDAEGKGLTSQGRRLGKGFDFDKNIHNKFNFQYFATFYVGSHLQEMDFILDTGSSWTWIPDQDCPADQCKRRHYEYSKSHGFRSHKEVKEVYYGIGYIRGEIVNDDIAIDTSGKTFARDVNFLSVKQA